MDDDAPLPGAALQVVDASIPIIPEAAAAEERAACAARAVAALEASRTAALPPAKFTFGDFLPRTIGARGARTLLEDCGGRCVVGSGPDGDAIDTYQDAYGGTGIYEGAPADWFVWFL